MLYIVYRDDKNKSYTIEAAAAEFELPVETVRTLVDIARTPILSKSLDNTELFLAK
jgi:hypothetical protein